MRDGNVLKRAGGSPGTMRAHRPQARIGASSLSPQSLKSPATISASSRGTCASMNVGEPLHLAHAARRGSARSGRRSHAPSLPFHVHRHVQQAALLEAVVGDVVMADVADRPARQQRVAVLAVARRPRWCGRRRRSPRARGIRPAAARGQPNRVSANWRAVALVHLAHLLQEHEVGVERLDAERRGCGSRGACAGRRRARPCGCCRSRRAARRSGAASMAAAPRTAGD